MTEIIINAKIYQWKYGTISYSQLVDIALTNPIGVATIQFSRGPKDNQQGTLGYKHYVEIKDGMVFDVTLTDNA